MIKVDRVQRRLDDLQLNPFSAARQAGLEAGYVRDILRGKIKEPGAAKLTQLATVLKCSTDYLMGLVEEPGPSPGKVRSRDVTVIADMPIRYEVAAGAWLAVDEIQDIPYGSAPTALIPEYSPFQQWLERVRGESMNKILPDGALVHVVSAIDIRYEPKTDDLVVVVRRRAGGAFIERTVKQVVATPQGIQLWPRSYNPRWQEPLVILQDTKPGDEVEVTIEGKVVRAYLQF